jgi:diguanylate cyclase (GGDEF)-like protein
MRAWSPFAAVHDDKPVQASPPIAEIIRENVFVPYRSRILFPIAAAAIPVMLPFGFYHLLVGHMFLGALLLFTVGLLTWDTFAVYRGRSPPVPFPLLILAAAAMVAMVIPTQGLTAAIWMFPIAIFGYFAMPRNAANFGALALLCCATAMLFAYDEPGAAIRLLVSLGFCILALNLHLNVLDAAHEKLAAQSMTDPLTGAFNRRHMDTCLAHVLERQRRSGAVSAILLVDVDRLRDVNDRHGEQAGDAVLRALAERVRGAGRKLDLLFRVAGDKFLLLLPDTEAADAVVVAEHVRATIAQGGPVPVTASIAVAQLDADEACDMLLARASRAIQLAKTDGRNRVRWL